MKTNFLILLIDYQIIVSLLIVFAAWKWGDWKNWRLYYPTILFFIATNFLASVLTFNYPLWEYESPLLKTTLSDILIALVFFPATILLYLPYFPKGLTKGALYVFLWVIIYTITEIVSHRLGYFSYHHNWNIWWSILFNLVMFPILLLHHKSPPRAWLLSVIVTIAILIHFEIPFSSLK